MEQLTVEQWRERILAGWEKWGTGVPLDPRTVEHLAVEFAKPMLPIPAPEPILDLFTYQGIRYRAALTWQGMYQPC